MSRCASSAVYLVLDARAREPNNMARSSRMSAGIRAKKSRTALSVSGSENFMIGILCATPRAGNFREIGGPCSHQTQRVTVGF
jgi:hypothetical protein